VLELNRKEVVCPVCDITLPNDSDECPKCGLERKIIEMEGEDNVEDDDIEDRLGKLLSWDSGEDGSEAKIEDKSTTDTDEKQLENELKEDDIEDYDDFDLTDDEIDKELGLLGEDIDLDDELDLDEDEGDLGEDIDLDDELDLDEDEGDLDEGIDLDDELDLDEDEGDLDEGIDLDDELDLDEDDLKPEELDKELGLDEDLGVEKEKPVKKDHHDLLFELGELEKELSDEEIVFECPVCSSDVDESDSSCPSCGAVFEEELSEDELEVVEMMEEIVNTRNKLKGILNTDIIDNKLARMKKERTKNVQSAYNIGLEALSICGDMVWFQKMIDELEDEIKDFKKRGWNYKDYLHRLKESRRHALSGDLEEGLEKLKRTIDEIKRDKKSRAEYKDKEEIINSEVSKLNSILDAAKQLNIPLKSERDLISNALVSSKAGDVSKALDWLKKARQRSLKKIEQQIFKIRKDIDEEIKNMSGKKKQKIKTILNRADKISLEEKPKDVAELLIKTKDLAYKSIKMDAEELDKIKNLIDSAESIGMDCKSIMNYYDGAQKALIEGDHKRKKVYLQRAKDVLKKRLPRILQISMKEALKKLDRAKKKDENISKPVTYLKNANLNFKKKKYLISLENIVKFKKSIKPMLDEEKKEPKKAEITNENEEKLISVKKKESAKKVKIKNNEPVNEPPELKKGYTYLINEEDSQTAYSLFKSKLDEAIPGLCITRQYPMKVQVKYDLEEAKIIWLSDMDKDDYVMIKDLQRLCLEIEIFLSKENVLILLDGIEYLISNNDFRTVLHLIQSINDQVSATNSILIIPLKSNSIDEHHMVQLKREMNQTYPN